MGQAMCGCLRAICRHKYIDGHTEKIQETSEEGKNMCVMVVKGVEKNYSWPNPTVSSTASVNLCSKVA